MAIDGAAVSEDGEVSFRGHERLPFESLITAKKNGEKVTLSLLRHARRLSRRRRGGGGGGGDDDDKAERGTTADLVARVAAAGGAAPPPARVEVVVTLAPARELVRARARQGLSPRVDRRGRPRAAHRGAAARAAARRTAAGA